MISENHANPKKRYTSTAIKDIGGLIQPTVTRFDFSTFVHQPSINQRLEHAQFALSYHKSVRWRNDASSITASMSKIRMLLVSSLFQLVFFNSGVFCLFDPGITYLALIASLR